jgi:predicted PurR-regulated permease PerM
LSILFSIEKDGIIEFIAGFAGDQKEYVKIKLIKIYKKLGMWLKGQIFLCIYIGLIVWFGLWIIAAFGMNIPQKGSLAIIAGITEFLPYIGPLL